MKAQIPKQLQHSGRIGGFTFMELLVLIAVITILFAVFTAAPMTGRPRAKRINCTNHLKQVGYAFKVWALDRNDQYPAQVSVTNGGTMEFVAAGSAYVHFLALSNGLNTPKILVCPTDTNRVAATNWNSLRNRHLSYFVGLDANDTYPQTIISGDDNFTINGVQPQSGIVSFSTNDTAAWLPTRHHNSGNVAFADGSVQGFNSARMNAALHPTGAPTNRLAIQ